MSDDLQRMPNKALDRMTRSAVTFTFRVERHWRAPRHRPALRLAERARPRAQQRWGDFAFEFFSAPEHEELAAAEDGRAPDRGRPRPQHVRRRWRGKAPDTGARPWPLRTRTSAFRQTDTARQSRSRGRVSTYFFHSSSST